MNSIKGKMPAVKWIDKKKEFVIIITLLEYISYIWRHGQVVRQRSATPLSPVQIWLAPLFRTRKSKFLSSFFVGRCYNGFMINRGEYI